MAGYTVWRKQGSATQVAIYFLVDSPTSQTFCKTTKGRNPEAWCLVPDIHVTLDDLQPLDGQSSQRRVPYLLMDTLGDTPPPGCPSNLSQ